MANLVCLTNISRNVCKNLLKTNVVSRSFAGLSQHEGRRLAASTNSFLIKNQNHQIIYTNIVLPQLQILRSTSFFSKTDASQLWKGVTSVSAAGNKRGRGKGVGKKLAKNLNRGQRIGDGSVNMLWPGLTSPVLRGKELIKLKKLRNDPERLEKLQKMRDSMGQFRPVLIDPLDRGWSGSKFGGRSIGPPPPIGEETFEGFDTKVLEFKFVTHMSGVFGRKRQLSVFAVTGNGNGLGGFALAKAQKTMSGLGKVKSKASQKLMYIERYNGHTVMHNFFSQFGATKIFVKKKPEGFGLVCHRALRSICEVIGIKDIYIKAEGSTSNVQNLTKAFFLGLVNQKTHQQLADEKQLHLVEFREENLGFPKVVASPQSNKVRSLSEIPKDEELNFDMYVMNGKVELQRKKYPPGYTKLYGYEIYKKKYAKYRNHEKIKQQLLLDYGEIRSFLADEYPECRLGGVPREKEAEA